MAWYKICIQVVPSYKFLFWKVNTWCLMNLYTGPTLYRLYAPSSVCTILIYDNVDVSVSGNICTRTICVQPILGVRERIIQKLWYILYKHRHSTILYLYSKPFRQFQVAVHQLPVAIRQRIRTGIHLVLKYNYLFIYLFFFLYNFRFTMKRFEFSTIPKFLFFTAERGSRTLHIVLLR